MRFLEGVVVRSTGLADHIQYVDVLTSEGLYTKVLPPVLSTTNAVSEAGGSIYSSIQVPLHTRCIIEVGINKQTRIVSLIPKTGTKEPAAPEELPEEVEDPGDIKFYRASNGNIVSGIAATTSLAMLFLAGYSDPDNPDTQDFYRLGLFSGNTGEERSASVGIEGVAPKIKFKAANSFLELSETGTRTCVVDEEANFSSFVELSPEGKAVIMGTNRQTANAFLELNGKDGEINLASKNEAGNSWLTLGGGSATLGLGEAKHLGLSIQEKDGRKYITLGDTDYFTLNTGNFVLEATPEAVLVRQKGSSSAVLSLVRDNEGKMVVSLDASTINFRADNIEIDSRKNLNIKNPGFKLSASGDPTTQGTLMQLRDLMLVVSGEEARLSSGKPVQVGADLQIQNKASLNGFRLVHIQELYALLELIVSVFNTHTQLFGEGIALPPLQQIVLPYNI